MKTPILVMKTTTPPPKKTSNTNMIMTRNLLKMLRIPMMTTIMIIMTKTLKIQECTKKPPKLQEWTRKTPKLHEWQINHQTMTK